MALVAGTRLGPYEIEAPLGAGGMGEVYRARDTRLDRTVAIKVLPSHLSGSSQLRQRFEREARAISRLNHPHICILHDVDLEGERGFLVMEHLEGESLAARLLKGFLPLDEALQRADEILDALDAAHRAGIVHRDLKPGNVMLTASGAKVLDFGLSRHLGPVQGSPDSECGNASMTDALTAAPTLTAKGTIVGTPPYMAPEQAQGRAVDTRADLFAFGALLFEMLIGQRAFNGNSTVAVVAAVLEREVPAPSSLRPDLPVALDAIVKRCFAKDPEARWQSARDLRFALQTLSQTEPAASPDLPLHGDPGSAVRSRQRERAVWAILLAGFAVTLGWLVVARGPAGPPPRLAVQLSLPLPEATLFPHLEVNSRLAVSPDGRQIAFSATSSGLRHLWVRRLDERTSRLVAGTEGAMSPFWSPDGRFVGYFAQGRMMKVEVTGGPARLIHEGPLEGDAEWGEDGDILFASGQQGIFRISSDGGKPTQLTHLDPASEWEQLWPRHLPGGTHILYLSIGPDPAGRKTRTLYAFDLAAGAKEAIPEVGTRAAYADGHLVYAQDGTLLARPFDAVTRRFTGDPVPLVERLSQMQGSGLAEFSLASGTLAYHAGTPLARLVQSNRRGETVELGEPAPFGEIRRSPDGHRLAASLEDPRTGSHDLWIYDTATGVGTRLTSDPADEQSPVWSPDGQWIYYRSDAQGPPDIYARRTDGSGQEKRILSADWPLAPVDLSPDGRLLLYEEFRRERGGTDLGFMSLADSSVLPFLQTPFGEHSARISPVGRWVAFVSDETGKKEIYVSPVGSGETRRRISISGGNSPRWRPDGRELLYVTPDATIMSVPIADASGEPIGSPRVLMRRDLPKQWGEFEFGLDGESIVAIRQIRDPRDEPLQILLGWQSLAGR